MPVSDIEGSFDAWWRQHRPDRYYQEQREAGHFPENMRRKHALVQACAAAGLKVIRRTLFNVWFQNVFDYRIRHRVLARLFDGQRIPFAVYHHLVAPLIELCTIVPDPVVGAMTGIGASIYLLVGRSEVEHVPG